MTDEAVLAALDQRGARAGAARLVVAGRIPVPDFDPSLLRISVDGPERPRGRRRWIALVGAAAAVALVVAAAVVLAGGGGDDDSAPTDQVPTRPSAPFVLDAPPDGLGQLVLGEGDETLDQGEPAPFGDEDLTGTTAVLYGPAATEQPRLAAVAVRGGQIDGEPAAAEGMDPIEAIGGRRAWRSPPDGPGSPSLLVQVGAGHVRLFLADAVADASAVDEVLREAALGTRLADGRGTVDADRLPGGWSELGTVDGVALLPGREVTGATSRLPVDGWRATYLAPGVDASEPDPATAAVAVWTRPGDELDLAARRFWAPQHEEVTVRGHPAVLVDLADDIEGAVPDRTVSWVERAGVVVDVTATGLGRDELLARAEGLHPASGAEIDRARGATLDARLAVVDVDGVVLGRGRLSDGRAWGLVASGGPTFSDSVELVLPGPPGAFSCVLDIDASVGPPGSGVSPPVGEDVPVVGSTCRGTSGDLAVGYGLVRAEAVEVALVELAGGGSTEVDRVEVVAAEGWAGFVVELPDADHRYRVVAYDADGTEIGRDRLGS